MGNMTLKITNRMPNSIMILSSMIASARSKWVYTPLETFEFDVGAGA